MITVLPAHLGGSDLDDHNDQCLEPTRRHRPALAANPDQAPMRSHARATTPANIVRNQHHRASLVGRFDADAAALSAGPDGPSALSRPRRRGAGLAIRERTRAGSALPCQVHDPDLWFADAPCDLERAKALCGGCPAQLACLTGAIDRREPAGVWGGQILDNGEIVTHKRPRGRPRNGSAMPRHWLPQPLAASDRDPLAWP
jgi:WhiB family redox-sensing transcriptional regulator